MKLHETSVLGYSRVAAPPDRQGRLYKKSERSSSYQRRWCELRGNLLFYWERQGDREPLGLILLEGCTVELQESATEPFTFEISYPQGPLGHRAYKMAAEDQASMEGWVRALSTASFDYLRALLTELEGQYWASGALGAIPLEERAARRSPLVGAVGLPDFEGLHRQFGEEIMKLRVRWRKGRAGGDQTAQGDLIDLE
ncbi:sperm-associated antigen 8 [Platysternon megacephalum]|uniref:Sperm-associated antigen 8 n=1 Tax=Platysternon megacephalum TaxID=55544 RepID=A0A4D9DNF7_9SAUR|nr:sperm-associated antigen 8 [Platysternon megacephalum]